MGTCWDADQELTYKDALKGRGDEIFHKFDISDNELRLPLQSLSQNTKEVVVRMWILVHLITLFIVPFFMLVVLAVGGWSEFLEYINILVIGGMGILISKYLYRLLDKFELIPNGQYVIFNRQMGMVEIANDKRSGYHNIPFEQFNAHHRTVHSERGTPYYGFTLLHYKEDLMYQVADYSSVKSALVHWELIKNFMDTSQPLADIPEFERYRVYDPTTIAHDKKHGRPANFWCRVDKKFMKKISDIAFETAHAFPSQRADTFQEALQHGYKVPDILLFPWKEAASISDEPLTMKSNWFSRFIFRPLFLY